MDARRLFRLPLRKRLLLGGLAALAISGCHRASPGGGNEPAAGSRPLAAQGADGGTEAAGGGAEAAAAAPLAAVNPVASLSPPPTAPADNPLAGGPAGVAAGGFPTPITLPIAPAITPGGAVNSAAIAPGAATGVPSNTSSTGTAAPLSIIPANVPSLACSSLNPGAGAGGGSSPSVAAGTACPTAGSSTSILSQTASTPLITPDSVNRSAGASASTATGSPGNSP